jgi:type I restriction enzyme S subunit
MSFPRYPAYKPSGVEWLGEVPEHWEAAPIKRFGLLKGGAGFPHENQGQEDAELSFHKVNALGKADHRGVLPPSENTITRETAKKLGAFVFPPSAIVFAKVGAALLMGRIRVLKRDACIDNNMMGLVVHSETHDFRFAMYAMQLVHFDLIANPGAVPSLNEGQIGNFKLAVPPVEEQSYIATFLDHETAKIDALIAEQQRLIELLQEKRQAVISHAVTKGLNSDAPMKDSGVEWLGEVPEHWEILELKHLKKEGTSITYGIVQAGPHIEDGIPYIRTSDMASDRLKLATCQRTSLEIDEFYARSRIAEGDLVVAIRATVGKVLEVPLELDGANLTQGTAKFSPGPRVYAKFVKSSFEADYCQSQIMSSAKGATFLEITLDVLRRIRLAIPPLTEQKEIVLYLAETTVQLGELLDAAELTISLLQERRSALISAAVTGQIDVRGLVPEAVAA